MRGARARTLAMATLVGLMSLGATEPPKAAAPGATPQEAEVTAVMVDPGTRQPVVLLQGKRDRRPLVMAIGQFEANGIAIALQGLTPPRPLTHDLFLTVLGDLRASLKRIVVTDLRDDVFYAQLHLEAAGGPLTIDSRPSDAIALALRARVPILVEDRVFDKAERLVPKGGGTPTPTF
jgi:bifunctional DNase/RNase